MTPDSTPSAVLALHESTKHGTPPAYPDRLVHYRRLDPANAPAPFKRYRSLPLQPLPRTIVATTLTAAEVMSGRTAPPTPLDLERLATLLFLTGGVTRTARRPRGVTYFRAAMSAGNLHPVELYVVAGPDADGRLVGVHHFDPLRFGLTRLRSDDVRGHLGIGGAVAVVMTGIVWRTTWKYGERGWRHLYWDAGSQVANLAAAAAGLGIECRITVGFDDRAVARAVGVDGTAEMPLVMVELGRHGARPAASTDHLQPLDLAAESVAPSPVRLPMVVAAQAESALSGDQALRWRAADPPAESDDSVDHPRADDAPIETVILRRGSTRLMVPKPVEEAALRWPMRVASRPLAWDAGVPSVLSHLLSVHAVGELEQGAYRWAGTDVAAIARSSRAREIAAHLCLDQPLGGDSAYTVFHAADLRWVLDELGPRGYRVAQLEAGIASERLALAAFAIGLGATGLTFYDDAVSRHFRTEEAPVLATSVGVPATPPAASGGPGTPVELGSYGEVIRRLTRQLRERR